MPFTIFFKSGFRISPVFVIALFFLIPIASQAYSQQTESHSPLSIMLTAHENDRAFGEQAVKIAREHSPMLCRILEINQHLTVHILVAGTESDFQRLTGGIIPDWGIAAAEAERGLIFLKSPRIYQPGKNLRSIVIHELSHVVMGNAVRGASVPRWFEEGFALYNSGESGTSDAVQLSGSLLTNQLLTLREIDDVLMFQREKAALAYREALSAIEYLVEKHGAESIAGLTQALSNGESMEESIRQVTGLSMNAFENEWMEYIKSRYRWYIFMDMRLILSITMVSLFLAAYIKKRHQIKEKKKQWEIEAEHEIFSE
jgi:hypothetical protein